eukprot:jgi/Mesen1/3492/ME000197S02509
MGITEPEGWQDVNASRSPSTSELLFLGSGSSTGVPTPSCVINPTNPPCAVCHKAMTGSPKHNRNYRCNPSLMIDYAHEDGSRRYIQIDAGKCFREQVLRWFTHFSIPKIDALVLTHEHADAILGLDDIRGVQSSGPPGPPSPLPVFLTQHCMDSIAMKFPYLLPREKVAGAEFRRVAQIDWQLIAEASSSTFSAAGLDMTPLPVMHGEDYISLGFLFGKRECVAYVSDVSRIPPEVEQLEGRGAVDLLILDSLYKGARHNTHICFAESLEIIRRLRPKRAYLIGMTHEFDHEETSEELRAWSEKEGINVQLSYDGLRVPVDL